MEYFLVTLENLSDYIRSQKCTSSDPKNDRPENHTLIVSKTMEILIKNSLIAHPLEHGIINSEQHDFLRRKSRPTCMTDCLNANAETLSI